MSDALAASLIVSTYEMPRHLELVCAALERQTAKEIEFLICDDGSREPTREVIQKFIARSPFPVKHLWQEDKGFRKCRILNEALRVARGKTLVFLDGDTVPHRDYVKDHLDLQEPGRYLAGRRVMLGEKLSDWLTPEKIRRGFFDRPTARLAWSVWRGDSEHFQRSLRVQSPWLRDKLGMGRIDDLIGCNYSVPREALLAINGFDEDYEGYGREDTDAEIRLQNLGLKIKSAKGLALQFHVWHPRREFTPANDDRLEEARRTKRIRCANGMTKGESSI